MKVKYKDIAKTLGISTTAVSIALNNKPGVSEETRKKVFELYKNQLENVQMAKPSPSENITEKKENEPILFVIHKKHGEIINDKPFFSDLIATIEQESMNHAFPLRILHYLPGQDIHEFIRTINNIEFAGIVLLATEMDANDLHHYSSVKKPIVILDSSFDFERFDSVEIANKDSILQAMEYVYKIGHRNIGYLQSSVYINNFGHRFDGYKNGLRYFNLEGNNNPVFSLHSSMDQAYLDMKRILENKSDDIVLPTVFLSDLDYIAIGAARALQEHGLKIPDDISIIGYDDVVACEMMQPPLTTIRVNRLDIGRLAVERLLQLIDHSDDYYTTIQISTDIVIRQSVKSLL